MVVVVFFLGAVAAILIHEHKFSMLSTDHSLLKQSGVANNNISTILGNLTNQTKQFYVLTSILPCLLPSGNE